MPAANSYSAADVTVLDTHRAPIQKQHEALAPNPTKVKTGTRPRAAHEVPLLTVTASRVIEMEDASMASESSETPSTIEKSPLDFANEDPPQTITERGGTEDRVQDKVAYEIPSSGNASTTGVALKTGLEEEVAAMGPLVIKGRRKREYPWREIPSFNGVRYGLHLYTPAAQDLFTATKSVSDPELLSYAKPQPDPEQDMAQSSKEAATEILTKKVATTEAKNLETLLEAEVDIKKAAEVKNVGLTKELESFSAQFAGLQVRNNQLSKQVSTLQTQVTGEERLKTAFEEFKKYEDDKVEQRCAKIDARLDKLRLAKGMSGGLKYGIEHGKAGRDLANIEAYDSEANSKLVKALQDLKDLKYLVVDQLEGLKDAPMELIMASLHLESDTEEDAPQWIRDLRPSSSQLKIPVYPEVRDPEDPWAVKEEMLLEDAIAANISRAEKKKKCRVVCRTHRIGFAHHTRSDGIPVSAPTVVPQWLAILLADAATQTEVGDKEEELHPRLQRSILLPPVNNL
ncbi:hypothetical protein Tco_1197344 [Tanacetum coccineum]